jgi:hypothetical protein
MLLNDIGKPIDSTLKRINDHLEENYGFKISQDVKDRDLVSIMEQIREEITDLKIQGEDAKTSPEISKRLLVLEGMKKLQEFALMQFQSPKLDFVVDNLVDFVVDTFEISGMQSSDFDKSLERAMEEYRSSRYRFPDSAIEDRVRVEAMAKIQANVAGAQDMTSKIDPDILDSEKHVGENFPEQGKRQSAVGGAPAELPTSRQGKYALQALDSSDLDLEPISFTKPADSADPYNRMGKNFMAPSKRIREGTNMKEHANLVKNLRLLLETEVSEAEVMMAAKEFAKELQEMVEKIGRLQNEDLPPVTDQMRETYGTESASAFQTQIYGALQGVMDSLYTAKNQVDDAVTNMATTGQFSAQTDMDKSMDDEMTDLDIDADEDELDLDNLDDIEVDDEFGAADEEEPLGREMKESMALRQKVAEMQKLVEKARKLREARG